MNTIKYAIMTEIVSFKQSFHKNICKYNRQETGLNGENGGKIFALCKITLYQYYVPNEGSKRENM